MDIGTLTGQIALEDQVSDKLREIGREAVHFAEGWGGAFGEAAKMTAIFTAAVGGAMTSIILLGREGSTIDDVTNSFDKLAIKAGTTGDALREGLTAGVQGTVSELKLMETTSRILTSGMKLTEDQTRLMGQAAREMAKATGGDAASSMQTLSTAMTTGRTRGLELAGIHVDLKKAELDFATSIGVTVKQLSTAGVLEAKRIGELKAMQEFVDRVGISQLSFKERLQQAQVALEEWSERLARMVATSPHVMGALDAIGKALQDNFKTAGSDAIQTLMGWINDFADAVAKNAPIVIHWAAQVKDQIVELWKAAQPIRDLIGEVFVIIAKAATTYGPIVWEALVKIKDGIVETYKMVIVAWDKVPDWFKRVAENAAAAGIAASGATIGLEIFLEKSLAIGAEIANIGTGVKEMWPAITVVATAIGNVALSLGGFLKSVGVYVAETIVELGGLVNIIKSIPGLIRIIPKLIGEFFSSAAAEAAAFAAEFGGWPGLFAAVEEALVSLSVETLGWSAAIAAVIGVVYELIFDFQRVKTVVTDVFSFLKTLILDVVNSSLVRLAVALTEIALKLGTWYIILTVKAWWHELTAEINSAIERFKEARDWLGKMYTKFSEWSGAGSFLHDFKDLFVSTWNIIKAVVVAFFDYVDLRFKGFVAIVEWINNHIPNPLASTAPPSQTLSSGAIPSTQTKLPLTSTKLPVGQPSGIGADVARGPAVNPDWIHVPDADKIQAILDGLRQKTDGFVSDFTGQMERLAGDTLDVQLNSLKRANDAQVAAVEKQITQEKKLGEYTVAVEKATNEMRYALDADYAAKRMVLFQKSSQEAQASVAKGFDVGTLKEQANLIRILSGDMQGLNELGAQVGETISANVGQMSKQAFENANGAFKKLSVDALAAIQQVALEGGDVAETLRNLGLAAVDVDWSTLTKNSEQAFGKLADTAENTYELMLASNASFVEGAAKYSDEEVEAQRKKFTALRNQQQGFSYETRAQLAADTAFAASEYLKVAAAQGEGSEAAQKALKRYHDAFIAEHGDMVKKLQEFDSTLGDISQSFTQMATIADGSFSSIARTIGTAMVIAQQFVKIAEKTIELFGQGGTPKGGPGTNQGPNDSSVVGGVSGIGTGAIAAMSQGVSSASIVSVISYAAAWVGVAVAIWGAVEAYEAQKKIEAEAAQANARLLANAEAFKSATSFSDSLNQSIEQTNTELDHTADLLAKAGNEKALEDMFGTTGVDHVNAFTGQVTKAFEKSAEYYGHLHELAESMNLSSIIQELGGVANLTGEQVDIVTHHFENLFKVIAVGGALGTKATKSMDDALKQFADEAVKSGGFVSDVFLKVAKDAEKAGITLDQVKAFQQAQTARAATGLNTVFGGFAASKEAGGKGLQMTTSEQAQGLGGAVAGTFASALAGGATTRQAIESVKDSIDLMNKALKDTAFNGGWAFIGLTRLSDIAANAVQGPLLDAIDGAKQAILGMGNAGYLTQDSFAALALTATQAYQQIIADGGDANAATMAMQPTLQTIWEAEQKFGYETDAATQALIDQGIANGTVGGQMKSTNEQILDVLVAIGEAFGVMIPDKLSKTQEAAKKAADDMQKRFETAGKVATETIIGPNGIQASLDKLHAPSLTVDVDYDDHGGYKPTNPEPPRQHDDGGGGSGSTEGPGYKLGGTVYASQGKLLPFTPKGQDVIPVMAAEGESIRTISQEQGLQDRLNSSKGGDTYVDLRGSTVLDGPSLDRFIDTHVWKKMGAAQVKDTGGINKIVKKMAS